MCSLDLPLFPPGPSEGKGSPTWLGRGGGGGGWIMHLAGEGGQMADGLNHPSP